MRRGLLLLALSIAPSVALGQVKTGPDHGPVLATAIDVAPGKLKDTTKISDTKNYVFRSRIVSLGKDRSVSYCFDTEHMRPAGVWVGKPISYVAGKNMGPSVEGTMIFATLPGPGWSKDGDWKDPRKVPEGPIPSDWAIYKGVYLHGEQAVLSYSVGDCSILELPQAQGEGGDIVITRTLNLGPSSRPLGMLIAEEPKATGKLIPRSGSAATGSADGSIVELSSGVAAGVTGAPAGSSWEAVNGRIHLKLSALPKGAKIRVAVAKKADTLKPALSAEVADVTPLTKGGPARWTKIVETKGVISPDTKSPYVQDAIDLPTPNPWNASVRFGGIDFFPDGRAALCTWDGDVWVVSGLDGKLDSIKWKRFAGGLQQPLGLRIVDGVIHTAGRDQITRLVDLNNDGEADLLQNFNNEAGLTLQRHEFVMDLQTDGEGNFYFCRSGHYVKSQKGENCCVFKLSSDGKKLEVLAQGFREPNGMSVSPEGVMTVGDNEGNGVPQTPLYRLEPGKFYGFIPGQGGGYKPKDSKPIVWLPKAVDRSAGGQMWVPKGSWGPLAGQLLHTSYGHCALFQVLIDKSAEPWQGAAIKFPMTFASGIMRGRFSPTDGQLYVCGLRGWDTNATKDGQLARIRYTGSKTPVPTGLEVSEKGIALTFSAPLDRASAEDDQNWAGEWIAAGGKKGAKTEMPIEEVTLSKDGRTVTVGLESIMPINNYTLQVPHQGRGRLAGDGHVVRRHQPGEVGESRERRRSRSEVD